MSSYAQLTELELLDLLRLGDHASFTEIYDRYWSYLYKIAYALLKDSEKCDDLIQEIFVWVWLNREKHFTNALKPYLHATVKYKVANLIRHKKVKDVFYADTLSNFREAAMEENSIEVRELKAIINKFTDSLPDRAGQVFYLSRHKMLTNREIAKQMTISEKTVENQININLKKLRLILGKISYLSIFL